MILSTLRLTKLATQHTVQCAPCNCTKSWQWNTFPMGSNTAVGEHVRKHTVPITAKPSSVGANHRGDQYGLELDSSNKATVEGTVSLSVICQRHDCAAVNPWQGSPTGIRHCRPVLSRESERFCDWFVVEWRNARDVEYDRHHMIPRPHMIPRILR